MSAATRHRLDGLEPDNLLAFLALLGLLRALEAARPDWRPRAAWDLDSPPLRPVLVLKDPQTEEAICAAVSERAARLATSYEFPKSIEDPAAQADLNYSPAIAQKLLERAAGDKREVADLWSALMCDAAFKDDRVEATPFCLLFGQGHQHFLDRMAKVPRQESPPRQQGRKAVVVAAATALAEALFQPWHRETRPSLSAGTRKRMSATP